ncbi:MAG TPA: hypothetical protein VJ803_13085 [Gemmatimonadaceae bacterium]|nr:hypothetical protein [Gemmatimonadaceae bacterium]
MRISPRCPFALLLALALAACTEGPEQILAPQMESNVLEQAQGGAQQSISFVRHGEDRASLSRHSVSFWGVRGETRTATLGYADGTPMVTLTIPQDALGRDAHGREVARGDSIQITMTLLDRKTFAVRFEPAGLRFNDQAPAILSFNLTRAARKALASGSVSMWKQETPDSEWTLVPSVVDPSTRTLTANIDGFTVYALSY